MNQVMEAVGVFFGYALLALFAQNAIFTRALGVSRLVQLTGDDRTSRRFGLLLCVTQILLAPLAWLAGNQAIRLGAGASMRPLLFVGCTALVSLAEHAALRRLGQNEMIRILPLAALNSCVLGTVLITRTQMFTLSQSLGFGLGSGLGYMLAVLLVTEAQHRLRSQAIPSAFRGLPILLIYIGILALAIYGFTGHTVIL